MYKLKTDTKLNSNLNTLKFKQMWWHHIYLQILINCVNDTECNVSAAHAQTNSFTHKYNETTKAVDLGHDTGTPLPFI